MAMYEADAQGAMAHGFGNGEIRRLDVEIALDDLQVWRYLPEEFVG